MVSLETVVVAVLAALCLGVQGLIYNLCRLIEKAMGPCITLVNGDRLHNRCQMMAGGVARWADLEPD